MKLINLHEYNTGLNTYSNDDMFDMYRILENNDIYPDDLINTWVHNCEKFNKGNKKGFFINESFRSMKKVDRETYYNSYCRYWNPVEIYLICPLGGNFKFKDGNELYWAKFGLNTIDDTWWGVEFDDITYHEFNLIREKCFEYVESHDEINYKDLIAFGESLGGNEASW